MAEVGVRLDRIPPAPDGGAPVDEAGFRIVLDPTLDEVSQATAAIRDRLPLRLADADRHALEIAVAEVLTNVVKHGFDFAPGPPIELVWQEDRDHLEVIVTDCGQPIPVENLADAGSAAFDFDPTDLGGLPESGFGLALVRAAFDTIDYVRHEGTNRLRLLKRIA